MRSHLVRRILEALERLVFLPEDEPRGRLSVVESGRLSVAPDIVGAPLPTSGSSWPWVLALLVCVGIGLHAFGRSVSRQLESLVDVTALAAKNLNEAVARFELEYGRRPSTLDEVVVVGIVDRLPKDRWGRPFTWDGKCVRSAGLDGTSGTADDYVACRGFAPGVESN